MNLCFAQAEGEIAHFESMRWEDQEKIRERIKNKTAGGNRGPQYLHRPRFKRLDSSLRRLGPKIFRLQFNSK